MCNLSEERENGKEEERETLRPKKQTMKHRWQKTAAEEQSRFMFFYSF